MSDAIDSSESASPWLFLLGLVVFLGSTLLFVADLIRGVDVLRSVAVNGVGAIVLIAWAALDTYRSSEFEVATVSGALGTALLLYGLYLSISGFVVSVTGLFLHDRPTLGTLYLGLAIGAVGIGYLVMPIGELMADDEPSADDATETEQTTEN